MTTSYFLAGGIDLDTSNKSKLESDIHKLCATIWGQCADAMKAKLKAIPNHDTMDDNLDAVELLKGIGGLSHRFESSQCEFQLMADAINKQVNESNQSITKADGFNMNVSKHIII